MMNTSTILNICENQPGAYFSTYSGYAEPGYDDPKSGLVVLGNWNPHGEDMVMPRIGAILEKLGAELEWEDEWEACSECEKLVRTSPDSYRWTRSYWESEDGAICQDCLLDDPSDYLEYLEGNPNTANTLDFDLEDQGYRHVPESYENGLYGGQCDDPHLIAESLGELGIQRFIFEINSVGQFDLAFSVWIHKSEYHKLDLDEIESKGSDPALAMQSALRDASAKMRELDGPGVRVAKCNSDRTATVKLVTQQDFIDGKALD